MILQKEQGRKIAVLSILVAAAAISYMLINVDFGNTRFFHYSMRIRTPKLITMFIVSFAIGSAAIVFQTLVNNTIVTPCLLGMDALYTMLHTAVVFFAGTGSILVLNRRLAFGVDILLMGLIGTFIYDFLFRKTKHNILYVLLIGTVMSSLFGSLQSVMTRVMDPNDYDALLATLVASFSNMNSQIIWAAVVLLAGVMIFLRRDIALLDIIALGKDQAINLGVDYNRSIRRLLLGVTLYIAIATAMVGPLAFMGLITANLSRKFFKTYKHSYLIMGSALFGMMMLIGGEIMVQQIFAYNIPISVFITVAGGLYFLYLLLTQKKA